MYIKYMHIETLITRLPNDTIYVRMIIRIEVALYAIQGPTVSFWILGN